MVSSTTDLNASAPAVSLRGVSKVYHTWKNPSGRLFSYLYSLMGWRRAHAGSQTFSALHPVDLVIERGECLGIIGRNGAGKSTLLQLIAGTLQPTTGQLQVNGRVAALLELGSGFNPDFTGRENVHLNASILGLSKAEIDAKFESIVEYSGIAEFIDQPVHTYSSGMTLRLAFAVCVHVAADILIIDEALAVGDARFQMKCHATLDQMIKEGRTVIFVSHDTNSVKRMCQTAILLERGEVLVRGTPNDVTNIYTKLITSPHGVEAVRDDIAALKAGETAGARPVTQSEDSKSIAQTSNGEAASLVLDERAHLQASDKEYSYGGEHGCIASVILTDDRNQPRLTFVSGSNVRVRLRCQARSEIVEPIYAITIKSINGQEIFGTNTFFQNQVHPNLAPNESVEALFDIQLNVQPGVYFLSAGWVRLVNGEVVVIQRRYDVIRFDVLPLDNSFGVAHCPTQITVRRSD